MANVLTAADGTPYTVGSNGQIQLMPQQGGSSLTTMQGAPTQAQTAIGGSSLPQFSSSMTPDQAQALANQYLQAAGLPPDSGGQWAQYWQQFGQNDPNYFTTRLLNGAAQQGGNMAPFQSLKSASAPGGWGPGTSGYGPSDASGTGTLGSMGGSPQDALEQDPGYQDRLKAGMEAVQKSAAAKGTALTGGTLKDLTQFGQTFGSNEFQNVFNRNLSAAQLGLGATENANAAGSGYSTNAAGTVEGQGNAQAAGTVASGNAAAGATGTITNSVNQAAQNWSKLPQAQEIGGVS
jgi:hypothetical protein